jgi:hypothetical protein
MSYVQKKVPYAPLNPRKMHFWAPSKRQPGQSMWLYLFDLHAGIHSGKEKRYPPFPAVKL